MIKLNIQRFSSTNKTTHYDLSQYVASDKPTYLTDYNGDMLKIDTGINAAKTTADTASTAATNAQTTAETAQTTANTAVTNAATAQTTANGAVSSIGTLANLETVAKTNVVSAINELVENVVNTDTVSTTKSYSCSYSDTKYKLKHEHAEREIFSGSAADGNDCVLADNKTWEDYGVFSFLVVETKTTGDTYSNFILSYDVLSSGADLYSGSRNLTVRFPLADGITIQTAFVAAGQIKSNSIAFGNIGTDNRIVKIYIVE